VEDKIFSMLLDKEEITWKSIIHDLIRSNQIDPWDVDVSILAKRYIEFVRQAQEMDLAISGKVVFAAALLLRIKSSRLVGEDMLQFDRLLEDEPHASEEALFDEEEQLYGHQTGDELPEHLKLIPRTPQPRKRKVSIYDLMGALEKALEVKRRRVLQSMPAQPIDIPVNVRDITSLIRQAYKAVNEYYGVRRKQKLMFSQLAPSGSRDDRIFTFVPLLHLSSQQRIALAQETHFSDFSIALRKPGEEQENSKLPE